MIDSDESGSRCCARSVGSSALFAAFLALTLLSRVSTAVEIEQERSPETFGVVISSEVDNEILSGDLEKVYTWLAGRLGKEHVVLSAWVAEEERGAFYQKMMKEDKRTMEANPRRLREVLDAIGGRSKAGDTILIHLDGHGNLGSVANPVRNTISFNDDEDDMGYDELEKLIAELLPGRRVMILNLLCYGGGNHQLAFRQQDVCAAVGTNYRFSKSNPSEGDQFIAGFYRALKEVPNATFSAAYWQARLDDPHNADHAAISSEAYLDSVLKQGDYAPLHMDPKNAEDSLQVSVEKTQSLAETVRRIETLWQKGAFARPSEILPEAWAEANDHLTTVQIKWLQEVCGTKEWEEAKAQYEKSRSRYPKKVARWRKRMSKKNGVEVFAEKLLIFEEDLCKELCADYYCLVLAREIMEKTDRLSLLFGSDHHKERKLYIDLIGRENQPVVLQPVSSLGENNGSNPTGRRPAESDRTE